MKSSVFTMFFLVFWALGYSQVQKMHIDTFYEDKNELLIKSQVVKLDSVKSAEIIKRIKNWGGITFANFNKVLVAETDAQLVLRYVTNDYYSKVMGQITTAPWYLKVVIQVKDNKYRVLFYDDGACSGGLSFKAAWFTNNYTVAPKMYSGGLKNVKDGIISTLQSLQQSMLNADIIQTKSTDGW